MVHLAALDACHKLLRGYNHASLLINRVHTFLFPASFWVFIFTCREKENDAVPYSELGWAGRWITSTFFVSLVCLLGSVPDLFCSHLRGGSYSRHTRFITYFLVLYRSVWHLVFLGAPALYATAVNKLLRLVNSTNSPLSCWMLQPQKSPH